jgi:hypothetical protein
MDTLPPKKSFPKQAATASLFAPLLSFVIGIFLQTQMEGNRIGRIILGSISTLLLIAGFIFGITALVATKRHGRAGILGKALAGTLINGFFVLGMFTLVPWVMTHHTDRLTIHRMNTFNKDGVEFLYYPAWEIKETPADGTNAPLIAINGPYDSAVVLEFFPPSNEETLEQDANQMAFEKKAFFEQQVKNSSADSTMESVVYQFGGIAHAGFQSYFTVYTANAVLSYSSYYFMLSDSKHKILISTVAANDHGKVVNPGIKLILDSLRIEGMAPADQVSQGMADANAGNGGGPASLNVKMIVYKPKDACALIGNKTVMAGDVIEGFKIIAIDKDSITVQSPAGVEKELRLGDVLK